MTHDSCSFLLAVVLVRLGWMFWVLRTLVRLRGGLLPQEEYVDILFLSRARGDEGNGVSTNVSPSHLATVCRYLRMARLGL